MPLVQAHRYGKGIGKEHGALRRPSRQARLAQVRVYIYRVLASRSAWDAILRSAGDDGGVKKYGKVICSPIGARLWPALVDDQSSIEDFILVGTPRS